MSFWWVFDLDFRFKSTWPWRYCLSVTWRLYRYLKPGVNIDLERSDYYLMGNNNNMQSLLIKKLLEPQPGLWQGLYNEEAFGLRFHSALRQNYFGWIFVQSFLMQEGQKFNLTNTPGTVCYISQNSWFLTWQLAFGKMQEACVLLWDISWRKLPYLSQRVECWIRTKESNS